MRSRRFFLFILFILPALSAKTQLLVNEVMASNAGFYMEEDFYNFPDWVEIRNTGSSSVNLGNYFLSDDPAGLEKWRMPERSLEPGGFFVVYCDGAGQGDHADLGLNTEGEAVYIFDEAGAVIDMMAFGQQYPDISYGRDPADADQLLFCATPTPGSANAVSAATKPGPDASYSLPAGRLDATASLTLEGGPLRYTTDNSAPDWSAPLYTTPISLNRTVTVKSRTYLEGFLPGYTDANTYFVNEHPFTLPVVSLSLEPAHLFDPMIGIHVRGINGTEGYCGDRANWYQDWERPAFFEYFDETGRRRIAQQIGVKMAGGCTRGRDQKAMALYARGKYGDNDFDYPFFKEKPCINRFPSLLLRNSGNDQDQTLLRDAFLQALVKQSMDIDFQSHQPATVYLNGTYMGIYNLREKTNEDYVVTNYFIEEGDFDMLERDREVIEGTAAEYTDLVDFLNTHELAQEAHYQLVASRIDLQEYINWMTVNIYIANRDWPGNNHKFWKAREDGRWRWLMFDLDYGFGFRMDEDGYTHDSFGFATETGGPDHPNPPWSTLLFRKLLQNEGFKKKFLSTYLTHVYGSFEPAWCNHVLDSLSAIIETEIAYNQARWGRTVGQWEDYLQQLREYAVNRHGFMPAYVKNYFNLRSQEVSVVVTNPDPLKGKAKVNEAIIQMYPLNLQTYSELPLSVQAVPGPGFRFSHWRDNSDGSVYSQSPAILSESSPDLSIEPVFEALEETGGIYLNEVADVTSLFLDEDGKRSGFIELYNSSGGDVLLYSFYLSDNRQNLTRYAVPDSTPLPAGGFVTFYADGDARQGPFHTDFQLDRDGEQVYLSQQVGKEIVILDSVWFDFLADDASYGRYEDGTGTWQHMAVITPGSPNQPFGLGIPAPVPQREPVFRIWPNPTTGDLFVAAGDLMMDAGEQNGSEVDAARIPGRYMADLVDITGRTAYPPVWLNGRTNHLNIGGLEGGLYFVRIFRDGVLVHTGRLVLVK